MVKLVAEFLVHGVYVQIDFADLELIEPYRKAMFLRRGYPSLFVNGRQLYLHRFLLNPPKDLVVDHINRDITNNQRDNLRLATRSQNSINSGPQNGRKYKGVRFYQQRPTQKKCWHAQARDAEGKKKHLGYFLTEEEGARAYNDYVKKLHGEYAWLNDV